MVSKTLEEYELACKAAMLLDNEVGHIREDSIARDALLDIAKGHKDSRKIACVVGKLVSRKVTRWYA